MDIQGLWIISEVNAIGMNFEQTWRTVADLEADANVPPMQKMMAKTAYYFDQGGKLTTLIPKELDRNGECETFDDSYVVSHETSWKQENGKLFVAAQENGDDGWQEAVPTDNGFEVFGFFRIVKA